MTVTIVSAIANAGFVWAPPPIDPDTHAKYGPCAT